MAVRTFIILGRLDGLNKVTNSNRSHWSLGAKSKRDNTDAVALAPDVINAAALPLEAFPCHVHIDWFEPNMRRDPDNITSAKKFVFDGLQKAGIIENDGWKQLRGFSDSWYVDKENPRVEVTFMW
jgi:hypothetical protein